MQDYFVFHVARKFARRAFIVLLAGCIGTDQQLTFIFQILPARVTQLGQRMVAVHIQAELCIIRQAGGGDVGRVLTLRGEDAHMHLPLLNHIDDIGAFRRATAQLCVRKAFGKTGHHFAMKDDAVDIGHHQ